MTQKSRPKVKEFMGKILPSSFVPDQAKGWDKVIQFNLEGSGDWYAEVKAGKFVMREGRHSKPDMQIISDYETLYGILTGQIFAPKALATKKMRVIGPPVDAMRFSKLFKTIKPQ